MLPLYHCPTSALDLAVNIFSVHSPWQGCRHEQCQPRCLARHHLLTHLPPEAPVPVPHLPCWLHCTHLLCKDNSLWLWGTSQGDHISHGLGPPQHHRLTLGCLSHGNQRRLDDHVWSERSPSQSPHPSPRSLFVTRRVMESGSPGWLYLVF